jgi:hypothetical protein
VNLFAVLLVFFQLRKSEKRIEKKENQKKKKVEEKETERREGGTGWGVTSTWLTLRCHGGG